MKKLLVAFSGTAISCAVFLAAPRQAIAASAASDTASNYTSSTWVTGSNFGTGFGAWNLIGSSGNSGYYGNYVGGTGLSSNSFGLYAGNAGTNASADAQRPLIGALTAGQTFTVDLGHTTIQSGGSVGINFQTASGGTTTNSLSLIANGTNLYLNDGGSNFAVASDAANTDIKFTFTYNGGNSYSFALSGTGVSGSGSGYGASNDISGINQIQFFDYQQGANENFGFDNLAVVPEPSTVFSGLAIVASGVVVFRRSRRTTCAEKLA